MSTKGHTYLNKPAAATGFSRVIIMLCYEQNLHWKISYCNLEPSQGYKLIPLDDNSGLRPTGVWG